MLQGVASAALTIQTLLPHLLFAASEPGRALLLLLFLAEWEGVK